MNPLLYAVELLWVIIKWLCISAIIWTVLTYIVSPRRTFGNMSSHWQTTFPLRVSTEGFYQLVKERIQNAGIDNIKIDTVSYYEDSIGYSPHRTYLQVRRDDQMFLICAAPFGKEFFVSWRIGEPLNFVKDFLPRIPKLGPVLAIYIWGKTFYRMDTDNMFSNCIKNCVNEAIEHTANEHGVQGPDHMQQPTYIPTQGKLG